MEFYYFRCRSVTYAQRASKALESAGVNCGVAKLPQKLSNNGCGYSLKISKKNGIKAYDLLKKAGFEIKEIYISDNNAEYKEVSL